ncbi:MAG TPA: ATP-binding cassette domain-containing protein, partial [Tissierellia bacterium]|nr:ATP-binding cassette domain-containing protein [Tissierellia bacterium]
YIPSTSGTVKVCGYDVMEEPIEVKKRIGYLPENPPVYFDMTVIDYLNFVSQLKKVDKKIRKAQLDDIMELVGITDVRNRLIRNLSKGYKQRVGIAQALLGNPKVIILDEPTVGLDPIQIVEIRDLIKELGKTHTVIFSSHILSEVQAICDRVLIIDKGKLIAFDEPENLEKLLLAPNEIIITTDAGEEEIREILAQVDHIIETGVEDREGEYVRAYIKTDLDNIYEISRAVFSAFASRGKVLLEMTLKKANLEDVFIELTENSDHGVENKERTSTINKSESEVAAK